MPIKNDYVPGSSGEMVIHGNDYHDPDFEEEGVAATLLALHQALDVHTEPQVPQEHGNDAHNPDFAEASHTHSDLSPAHKDQTTGMHGVGGSTVESASGAQAKVNTHGALTTAIHGISSPLVIGHKLSARCKVYRNTTAQSIPEGSNTKIQYNAESYDNYTEFDPTTNYRFTPTVAGWYLIFGSYQIEASVDQCEYSHKCYKNGAEYAIWVNVTAAAVYGILGCCYLVYCNGSTDYLEFYAWQLKVGAGAKNLTASATRNFVEIFLLANL